MILGCNTNSNIALSDALPIALDLVYTSNLQSTKEQEQQQKYIEAMCVNAGLSAATYPSITANTDTSTTHQFVDTPASLKQLQKISVAAQSKRMVMVCGDESAGSLTFPRPPARPPARSLFLTTPRTKTPQIHSSSLRPGPDPNTRETHVKHT